MGEVKTSLAETETAPAPVKTGWQGYVEWPQGQQCYVFIPTSIAGSKFKALTVWGAFSFLNGGFFEVEGDFDGKQFSHRTRAGAQVVLTLESPTAMSMQYIATRTGNGKLWPIPAK